MIEEDSCKDKESAAKKLAALFLKNKLQTRATRVTIKANSGENMSKIKACVAKNTVTLQPTNYKEQ